MYLEERSERSIANHFYRSLSIAFVAFASFAFIFHSYTRGDTCVSQFAHANLTDRRRNVEQLSIHCCHRAPFRISSCKDEPFSEISIPPCSLSLNSFPPYRIFHHLSEIGRERFLPFFFLRIILSRDTRDHRTCVISRTLTKATS